jgi:hypothetical protein
MNGYSNLAGVIAGQLFKSKYAPHCTCHSIAFPILAVLRLTLQIGFRSW